MYEEKKLDEHRKRAGRTIESPIVLSDEGDEDEDDTARLSELIALAEVVLQADEDEDDTARLSELIALAETGLQAEEAEDDTSRLIGMSKIAELVNSWITAAGKDTPQHLNITLCQLSNRAIIIRIKSPCHLIWLRIIHNFNTIGATKSISTVHLRSNSGHIHIVRNVSCNISRKMRKE